MHAVLLQCIHECICVCAIICPQRPALRAANIDDCLIVCCYYYYWYCDNCRYPYYDQCVNFTTDVANARNSASCLHSIPEAQLLAATNDNNNNDKNNTTTNTTTTNNNNN